MTKIMVLGDTHGNTPDVVRVIKNAKRHGVKKIVQVGDFGLWDHFKDGVTFLDALNEGLRRDGVKMIAVGGNHDNWPRWNWYVENNPKTDEGFAILRSHIYLVPKTHHWSWQGKSIAAAGGAVSIDRRSRQDREKAIGPNNLWWADEQLTDDEVDAFPDRKVDYLFTHDCSNFTPFRGRFKPDQESENHRKKIDRVLAKSRPTLHFHGHMHTKYDWVNAYPYGYSAFHDSWSGPETQTYGLECDGMFWNWGILDLATDKFEFRPNVPAVPLDKSGGSNSIDPSLFKGPFEAF